MAKKTTDKRKAKGESKHSPRRINAVLKQRQALDLRLEGLPFDEIARRVGYRSKSGATQAIDAAIFRTLAGPAERVLRLEVARLDADLSKSHESDVRVKNILAKVNEEKVQDLKTYEAALKCEEQLRKSADYRLKIQFRRAKLLGLDAPEKRHTELTGKDGGSIKTENKVEFRPEEMSDEELRHIASQP